MNVIFAIIYVFGCLIAWFLLMYLEYRTFKKLIPEDVVVDFLLSVFSWVSAFVAIFLIFVQFVINLNVKFDFLTNFANLITRIFNKLENKLDMILIKTNLKQIPKKCTKCKFSGLKGVYSNNYNDFF